jgi:hypothetical protein
MKGSGVLLLAVIVIGSIFLPAFPSPSWLPMPNFCANANSKVFFPANYPRDVYFLVDISGDMAGELIAFKAGSSGIINYLIDSNSNTQFGLAWFSDYPIAPFGSFTDSAYIRMIDITPGVLPILNAIQSLSLKDGGDRPESQLAALYQAATGNGQVVTGPGIYYVIPPGQQANFRLDSQKVVVLFASYNFHQAGDPGDIPYPGPSFLETIAALQSISGLKVVGVSIDGGGQADLEAIATATGSLAVRGVDCNGDGNLEVLAGQPLVCQIPSQGIGVADAVVALVEEATAPNRLYLPVIFANLELHSASGGY